MIIIKQGPLKTKEIFSRYYMDYLSRLGSAIASFVNVIFSPRFANLSALQNLQLELLGRLIF